MKNQHSLFGRPITSTTDALCVIELGEGTEQDQIAAWQYLIDTGVAWTLQGWYGRNAQALIEQGLCQPPPRED